MREYMKKASPILAAALFGLWAGAMAQMAQAKEITLPPENIQWRQSTLPGYQKAMQECVACHSAHYAEYQPASSKRAFWEAQVKRMKTVFNAPIPDEDIPLITDYLVQAYSVRDAAQAPNSGAGGAK
jgi:sulfite dehydrogenase (cytochrome) subunit B